MIMKKLIIGLFFSASLIAAYGQEKGSFTDEELTKYATVMVWAESEKVRMADSVEVWVKSNDKLSAAAYNTLSRASKKGNIENAEATAEEKAEFELIKKNIEVQKESFKEVYVGKIKEDIGAGLYNKLKKSLKSNPEVKARYEAIYVQIESGGEPDEASDIVDSE